MAKTENPRGALMIAAEHNVVSFDDEYERTVRAPQRRYFQQLEFEALARLEREVEKRRAALGLDQREIEQSRSDEARGYSIDWDHHDLQRRPVRQDRSPPEASAPAALPYVDLTLDPIPPREWLVLDRIPARNVSSLSGEGSIGKSLLLMQLAGSTVLGKLWIGTQPEPGPVLYMSCEEDDLEVNRRLEDVALHLDSTRAEMVQRGLRFLSFAGKDAVLAQPDRAGVMRATPLFESLRRDALDLRPKLIVLDNLADIFAGSEIDRAQSRQFVTMLRGLAIDADSAVVMAAHPSLEGIKSNTGNSGSTGWHNSVRARMYFKPAPGDDTSLRVLEVKKNNYGPVSESIVLRWRDGVYVVEKGLSTLERLAAEAEVDHLFMKLLRRSTDQGRNVSDKPSPSYAPTVFAADPETATSKIEKQALAAAMARLFAARKIRVVHTGSNSRTRSKIVASEDAK
jgi:RecA-family ATPase